MTLQCRKHWSSFQFLLRVSPKRYIFLPIIIYFGRKTKETGVTFYYLIYFPLKFDLFIVFIILFMKVEDTPFLEGHSTAMQGKGNSEKNDSLFPFTPFALKPKCFAALITPYALVPCLSVPATSQIWVISIL